MKLTVRACAAGVGSSSIGDLILARDVLRAGDLCCLSYCHKAVWYILSCSDCFTDCLLSPAIASLLVADACLNLQQAYLNMSLACKCGTAPSCPQACLHNFKFIFLGYRGIVYPPADDAGTERTWFEPKQRPRKRVPKLSVHGKQSPRGASKTYWRMWHSTFMSPSTLTQQWLPHATIQQCSFSTCNVECSNADQGAYDSEKKVSGIYLMPKQGQQPVNTSALQP